MGKEKKTKNTIEVAIVKPSNWSVFKRCGKIALAEFATIKNLLPQILEKNPHLPTEDESYLIGNLIQVYRSYKRKNRDEIFESSSSGCYQAGYILNGVNYPNRPIP